MNWYYEENGQAAGPVSPDELARRFRARAISARTRVRAQESGQWLPLERQPAFAHLCPESRALAEPEETARSLTLAQLRDHNELTALTALYVSAAPMYLLLLYWLVRGARAGHGLG